MAKKRNSEDSIKTGKLDESSTVGRIDSASVGDTKPEIRTEDSQGGNETVAGFASVSPIDLAGAGSSAGADSSSGEPRRRRGRLPGTKNKQTTAAADLITDLTGAICMTNSVLVVITKCDEFDAPKEQVEEVAEKVRNFAQHFAVKLDPVKLAAFQLLVAIAIMYAPGIMALWRKGARPKLVERPAVIKPAVSELEREERRESSKVAEVPSQVWDDTPQEDLSFGTQ